MNKSKLIWKILLITGFIPFIIVLVYGIYSAIDGFSAICILNCTKEYGILAFRDSIVLYSYFFWPTYLIGLGLILLSIYKLRKYKRSK